MPLDPGKLDRLVTIQKPNASRQGPLNELTPDWANLVTDGDGTVWAAVRPATGREMIKAAELGAEIDTVVDIRFSNDVRATDPTHRLLIDGVVYEIKARLEPERFETIQLLCVARNEGSLPAFDYGLPPGDYAPSLDFGDARNSMYIPLF